MCGREINFIDPIDFIAFIKKCYLIVVSLQIFNLILLTNACSTTDFALKISEPNSISGEILIYLCHFAHPIAI